MVEMSTGIVTSCFFLCGGGGGMWRRQLFGRYSISCLFQNVEDSFEQLFLGVYGPNDDQEQMDL